MGQEDNVHVSIAHIVLCCIAGRGISQAHNASFRHPGMRVNFFIHGAVGFLNFQNGMFDFDFKKLYATSFLAARYLALPSLMADLYKSNKELSLIHLGSGLVPFALAVSGTDNYKLGNSLLGCNIISLCYYSMQNNREWGWYTAGAGLFAYFVAQKSTGVRVMYPLGLALMEFCAYRLFYNS